MSSIPEKVCRDILLRLPVRSILVCKCVCKDWYALITSSDFINAHTTIQKNNPILLLRDHVRNLLYQTGSLASSVSEFKHVIKMDYPSAWTEPNYSVRLLGSCNGLLSVWLCEYEYKTDWPTPWNRGCFWNPATREYKEIPQPPYAVQSKHICTQAFAYDHKNNDYKLAIGLSAREKFKYSTLFQVYSLSSDSWTIGPRVPYRFFEEHIGVLVNGDLHYLAYTQDSCLLLSLDISDVSFRELQVPKEFSEKNKRMSSVGVLEGCLSVLVSESNVHLEVWVMLDYGVLESWNKRFVIATGSVISDRRDSRILWSFENGQILLKNGYYLVLYDPKDGSARELNPDLDEEEEEDDEDDTEETTDLDDDAIVITNAMNYFISLVSLNSGSTYVHGGKRRTPESIET